MPGRKDYEERKEIKRQIYEERVIKAEQKSKEHYSQHQKISSSIPLGQPILTDHYSANRHRSDINKMDNAMRKSIAEDEKADYYRSKLNNIDNNNVISSDDPKAIEKLEKKIEDLEEYRKRVKSREHDTYELQNISQEIRRLKVRIKELKILDELDFQDIIFEGGKAIHNKEQNRIQILFDDKPNEEVRTLLKRYGFKWARSQNAWQRLFNKNGIYAVKCVIEQLEGE